MDAFALFRESDFVILSAAMSYSASGSLAVAMALEKPVVAPALGYFAETLSDAEDSLLYDPGRSSSLAGAMSRLLSDGGLRRKLSEGMGLKRKDFSPALVAQRTVDVYAKTMGIMHSHQR